MAGINLPKFSYGPTSKLNALAVSNGTFYYDTTRNIMMLDIKGSRNEITDVIHVASSAALPTVANAVNKLYLDESTGDLYFKCNNAWVTIKGGSSSGSVLLASSDADMTSLKIASNIGKTVLFVGTTTSSYSKGHIYYIEKPSTTVLATDITALGTSVSWDNVTNKPSTFPASAHTHSISDVTGLTNSLNSKLTTPTGGSVGDAIIKTSTGTKWGSIITVDTALDSSSGNPVANSVVKSAIDSKLDAPSSDGTNGQFLQKTATGNKWATITIPDADMKTSVYDTNNDGVVDSAANAAYAASAGSVAWGSITGKPSAFPASAHSHTIAQVSNLTNSLNSKLNAPATAGTSGQYLSHDGSNPKWVTVSFGDGDMKKSAYDTNNTGSKVDKASVADSVAWSGVTGKPSTFAPSTHSHTIAQVSNLTNSLNSKITAPSGGSTGQYLQKTANGYTWAFASITIDSSLSSSSGNPVANSVVNAAINSIIDDVDALKGNNIVFSDFNSSVTLVGGSIPVNGVVLVPHPTSSNTWVNNTSPSSSDPVLELYRDTNNPMFDNGQWLLRTYNGTSGYTYLAWNSAGSAGSKPWEVNGWYEGDGTNMSGDWNQSAKANRTASSGGGSVTDSAVKPKLMLTKPVSNVNLFLVVQSCASANGTYSTVLHTQSNAGYNKIRVFNGSTFVNGASGGVSSTYNNRVVVVDADDILDLNSYYRYQWVASNGSLDNSKWSGGYYPSANEQINNMASRLYSVEQAVSSLGITAVSSVSQLPGSPNSNVLYLIPESNN